MPDAQAREAWRLATALLVVLTVGSGFVFYNLSVYMNLLAERRGISVAGMSGAITVMFLVGAPVGMVVGRLIQRRDVRGIMLAGSALGGLALAGLGQVREVWEVYLAFAILGMGYTCVSLIPATTLVTRWFDDARRPFAMSFTSTGLSLGGVILTPLTVLLVSAWSWDQAMLFIGVMFTACIAPIAWFVVRPWPAGAGPAPPGNRRDAAVYRGITRSRFFVLVTAAYVITMAAQVGALAHLFNRAAEVLDPIDASFAVSILGAASIIGRLTGGLIVTRVPLKGFVVANLLGQMLGLTVLAQAEERSIVWLGAAMFGVTIGNLLMLHPLLLAQVYSVRHFPRLYSLSQSFTTLGVAGGPLLLGWLHDVTGYLTAFFVAAGLSAVAAAILATSRLPTRDDQAGNDGS